MKNCLNEFVVAQLEKLINMVVKLLVKIFLEYVKNMAVEIREVKVT